ncbi:transglycosylase domain-containing protein [Fumia xinanensis]|uniref:Penicillin-binding protein 1A n=1 Tax=Fumia xinanensis TaxID=2763659 RepID=A0A926I3B0_9FIRM|nr:transglycosylase domain-containing protein [Fumia xinanensis]MBC8560428.1 transglycosylase domain-containing protein [Fumia xinanensis]PWL46383.1 MAG: penicillin-binding protein [Clostridiales bacterium]
MSTAKKKKQPASRTSKTVKHIVSHIMRILVTMMLVCVITGCIVVTAMVIYVMNFMEVDNGVNLDNINQSMTTMLYAEDPDEGLVEIYRMSGEKRRIEVDLSDIPQYVQDAFIATEDKRFMDHEGVDWVRTISVSVKAILQGGSQGGSTITQQLVKNATNDDEVTPIRKLREIFRALDLERNYTKAEILESYLNIIFLGGRNYGVEAASQYYFGCHVWELTVPQAASLAGMTRSPNNRRPDLHPEKNKERRDYSLECMRDQGMITPEEYEQYIQEPVVTVDHSGNDQDDVDTGDSAVKEGISSYFVDAVIEDVLADLMEKYGWSRDYAYDRLKNGGYRIYTTEDIALQTTLEKKFADWRTFSSKQIKPDADGNIPEAAFVLMDYDGRILALVGGKGEKTESRGFNRATMAKRPPGSSMKPLAVYAPAVEYDLINWSTVLVDGPATKIDGKDWPKNYENKYYGDTTIVEAVRKSRNTIPVKLMQQLTPERSVEFLQKKFGITTLVTTGKYNDFGLSLSIGSMTDGLYLKELTAAYAPFGNGGNYYSPITYTRIEDANGNIILDNQSKKTRAISEDTASIMNRLLYEVVNGEGGTGREARLNSKMPVIGKTGTTQDYNDLTFVGMTPYYIGGVWTGYDTPKSLPYKSMYDPDTIWKNVMEDIHKGLENKQFDLSSNIVQLEYCTESGLLKSSSCPHTAVGYYKANAKPGVCDIAHGASSGGDGDDGDESSTPSGPDSGGQGAASGPMDAPVIG